MEETNWYFLITGSVVALNTKTHEFMQPKFNGLLVQNDLTITKKGLANCQFVLQKRFYELLGDEAQQYEIRDVVIEGIYTLGQMTKEQFEVTHESE